MIIDYSARLRTQMVETFLFTLSKYFEMNLTDNF